MNDDETELIAIGTKSKISQVIPTLTPMSISGDDISLSQSLKTLGVYLGEALPMDAHIKHLCCILFYQLSRTDAANKLTVCFILCRLDYCNSILAGLPDNKLDKLQRIQNHAAQLVFRKPRHVSATSLFRTLHLLQVKARIPYKITCLLFQHLHDNNMPPDLCDLLHPYYSSRTLRFLDGSLLTFPCFSLETFGKGSFSLVGLAVWNSLPLSLRKKSVFPSS